MLRDKILEREPKYIDYAGFTYDGIHSSQLGLYSVTSGNRYDKDLSPALSDQTVQAPGSDGTLIFGTDFTKMDFTFNIAYDSITEEIFYFMKNLFSQKKLCSLIFDETPYKQYWVKPNKPPQLKYICFDEGYNKERIYKGEGTLTFTCYEGFGRSTVLSQEDIDLNKKIKTDYTIKMAPNSKVTVNALARVLQDKYGQEVPYNESPDFNGVHLSLAGCKVNNDIYGRDGTYDQDVPIDSWISKNGNSIVINYNNPRVGFPTEQQKVEQLNNSKDSLGAYRDDSVINFVFDDYNTPVEIVTPEASYGQDPTKIELSGLVGDLTDGKSNIEKIADINPNIQLFNNSKTNSFELMANYLANLVEINSKTGEITSFDTIGEINLILNSNGIISNISIEVSNLIGEDEGYVRENYGGAFANFYEWKSSVNLPYKTPKFEMGSLELYNIGQFPTPINLYISNEDLNTKSSFKMTMSDSKFQNFEFEIDFNELREDYDTSNKSLYINSELRVVEFVDEDKNILQNKVLNKYIVKGDFPILFTDETLSMICNANPEVEYEYRYV